MLTILFLLAISIVNGAENPYYVLTNTEAIKLPTKLMGHITAIYADNLYVFGGKNATNGKWNNKFWKLALNGKFTLTQGKDEVTTTITNGDWIELTVTAPTYGNSTNNEFRCDGQCSVVIGQYLYIVGPYSSISISQYADIDTIYRLDLAASPNPAFASATEFTKNTLGYSGTARDACVTSAMSKMYTISGVSGNVRATDTVAYDPNTNPPTQTSKASLSTGRFVAGCGPNMAGDKIYLFGGKSRAVGVDTFDITADSWTDNADTNEFDTENGSPTKSREKMKCVSVGYQSKIECVGGYGIESSQNGAVASSIVWNYETRSEEKVDLTIGVESAGVTVYEFDVKDNDYMASIILVLGGGSVAGGIDTIQYAVRYEAITKDPTASPNKSPTSSPSLQPSKSPLCQGCTYPPMHMPSTSPSTPATASDGDGVPQINVMLSLIVPVILAIVY